MGHPTDSGEESNNPVEDTTQLWRRIPPWHWVSKDDRPSSAAFDDDRDGGAMSVLIADQILACGDSIDRGLAGHEDFGITMLTAAFVRGLGLDVRHDPTPDEPAHALVVGRKSKTIRRAMAKHAVCVRRPQVAT
ncbi:MAG: hypothetical protein ACRDYA_14185 [Egibacteraceae bacterium]